MEAKIIEILKEIKKGVDFSDKTDIISSGLLKSIDIITLISELEDEFDIEISVEDIVPDNFESVSAMAALVEKMQ